MPTATPHVRIRCVMLFLCTVLAFAEPALRAAMNTTIVATGLEPFGITLKAPNSPDFDARVRAIVPHWVNQALQLKPYVAVLSNTSARTVVAYALSFKCTRSDGTSDVALVQFKYPDAVAGDGRQPLGRDREVRQGEERVIATDFEIRPDPDVDYTWVSAFSESQKRRFDNTTRLDISVDAVIFDNGALAGADASRLEDHFLAFLKSKQELYRSVLQRINAGTSVDEVFRSMIAETRPSPGRAPMDDAFVYRSLAADDVQRYRVRFGDKVIRDRLAKALRDEPFVIRHVSIPQR